MAWFGLTADRPLTLKDDRGVEHAAEAIDELEIPFSLRQRLYQAERRLRNNDRSINLARFGVIAACVSAAQLALNQVPWYFVAGGLFVGSALLHQFGLIRGRSTPARARMGETLRAALRCAVCGYDMRGRVAEDDGCTVCPECGAAWKLDTAHAIDDERDVGTAESETIGWLGGAFRLSVLDAAGRHVRLTHPIVVVDRPKNWKGLASNVRRRLTRRLWCVGLLARLFLFPIAFAFVAFAVWRATLGRSILPQVTSLPTVLDVLYKAVLSLVPIGFTGFFLWLAIRPDTGNTKKIIDIWLDENLCPSCAGPIDDETLMKGDPVRCASCGSTWQRIGRATVHDVV